MEELDELREFRSKKVAQTYSDTAFWGETIIIVALVIVWLTVCNIFLQLDMVWASLVVFLGPLIGVPAILYFEHWRNYYSETIN